MSAQRRSLTLPLVPRDASAATDSRLTNCYTEKTPNGAMVIKRAGISVQNSLGVGCAQGATTFNGEALFIKSDTLYSDLQPFSAGSTWTAVTAPPKPTAADVGTYFGGMLLSLGGNLYSIGGHNSADSTESVYKSTDNGATWSTILATAPWTAFGENSQRAVVLNGRMFIIRGSRDCWASSDGIVWTKTNANITGDTKDCQALIVHNGLLVAFFTLSTASSVYASADGITWSSVTGAPGWAGRRFPMVYSLAGNLYLAGGIDNTTLKNDVWKSTDNGATWTQITAAAAFAARYGSANWVYNSKMWIGGGALNSGATSIDDDVYSSVDGITWTLITAASGWVARSQPSFTIHNNTMYIGPGRGGAAGAVSSLHFAALGGATSTSLTTPTQSCLPVQVAIIPANGAVVAKAFIKSTKDAWVWDGTTITKVSDADYPATTVYGVAYLDGAIYVMDSKGVIYGSDLLTPLSWNALNFITANAEADAGVAIARQLDNIIAFKETSIEFLYDAANPTGSSLGKQPNALLEIGCAASGSIAYSDNTLFFMSQHKQRGRSVMKFVGTTPQQVSTPWVDRILDGDDLATIYAFVVRLNGHVFYFLTLRTSAITLVYDDIMNEWHTATKLTAFPAATVSTIAVQTDGSILVTMPLPHGSADGDPVTIAGATQAAANGLFNLRYDTSVHAATQFSYVPATAVSGSITGTVTVTLYSSSYFPGAYYARSSTADLVLDEATGSVYKFSVSTYQDNGAPIDVKLRTEREDFGSITPKAYNSISMVADNVAGNLAVRYTSNDYSTFSKYRLIDLSKRRPRIDQLGSSERRAWEFRHTGNTAFRLLAAEVDIIGWNR